MSEFKDNVSPMLHGGSLNKVRNPEAAFQRAANTMLMKIDPVDTIREAPLANTIHDDVFNYSLPSDYKRIIDLFPQGQRNLGDKVNRNLAESFDVLKGLKSRTISIEGNEGTKIIRINWRSRAPKTLNTINTLTSNGTWVITGTASNLSADRIDYISGNGSLKFDVAVSGDGVQNSSMTAVDLTDEDETGDFYLWFKIKNSSDLAKLTSVSLIWGNDLTTFWTGVAQTLQADDSAFKVGWNQIKIPWSTASETGIVVPTTIDSLKVTFAVTGAITGLHLDNITCSNGRNFDIKYYSKYILKNPSGTWIAQSTSADDEIILDTDAMQIYLLETVIACAHQMEGADSSFDMSFATSQLDTLYKKYRHEYPTQSKKAIGYYGTPSTLRHFSHLRRL